MISLIFPYFFINVMIGIFSAIGVIFFVICFCESFKKKEYVDIILSIVVTIIMFTILIFSVANSNLAFDTHVNKYLAGDYHIEQIIKIVDSDTTSVVKYKLH